MLDAVALTALAGAPELLEPVAGRVVLTPNSGELAALLEGAELPEQEAAHLVAERYGAVVSARGWVVAPDGQRLARPGRRHRARDLRLRATSWPGWSAACWRAAPTRRRPRSGASTCTPRPATGSPPGWAASGFLARELLDEVPAVLSTLRP